MDYRVMIHKMLLVGFEYLMAIGSIMMAWGSFPGYVASVLASLYFGSMLKVNVVNPYYDKSWIKYFKSIFNIK